MSELTALLAQDAIAVGVSAADWREAIEAAGALLVDSGVTSAQYSQAMLRAVEEHGPYIVIAPGFALAHARPDDSVRRTGMSFVRLAEPVKFGHTKNDPVSLVMGLAALDDDAHRGALVSLAKVLGDPVRRAALDSAATSEEVLRVLGAEGEASVQSESQKPAVQKPSPDTSRRQEAAAGTGLGSGVVDASSAQETVPSKGLIFTVCGNGLGTSLFLKNTLEQVLGRWGWSSYVSVEATDTISARGKAKDADFLLTSRAIAETLGDVGVPVEVIEDFTSQAEVDASLRRLYAL